MAGVKAKSGGSRFSTHPKSKMTSPEVQAQWKAELHRAISTASSNFCFLRKNSFYSLREIRLNFGRRAVDEFKSWFEAERLFDQVEGDRLYHEWKSGKIDEALYKKFLHTRAHSWSWMICASKRETAWKISRGLLELT